MKKEKDKEESLGLDIGKAGGTIGGVYGIKHLNEAGARKLERYADKQLYKDNQVFRELLKKVKSQGIEAYRDKKNENTAKYIKPYPKETRNKAARKIKKLRKAGKYSEARKLLEEFKENDSRRGEIVLGTKYVDNPTTLAHELGHAQYTIKSGEGGKIGRVIDKTALKLRKHKSLLSGVRTGHSLYQGISAGQEGGGDIKHLGKTLAVSGVLESPELINEFLASRKGLQYLKKAGISGSKLKASKKDLSAALGTYALHAGYNTTKDLATYGVGRIIGKHMRKSDEK